jgi:glycosyltransferase involved in cell wall biosynthesis
MRVLLCHVSYREPGGEDAVFHAEVRLLRQAGVDVATLELSSAGFRTMSVADRARVALRYADHTVGRRLVRSAILKHRPSVVHFHNLYPQLGPSAVREASRLVRGTVQTLHNYRLSCLTGRHVREGRFCQSCQPGRFGAGIAHACYRGSRVQGLLAAGATTRQWQDFVQRDSPDLWLVLTPFMKTVYERMGAPPERIVVKANSVDPGQPHSKAGRGGVFCGGRLSEEKGIVPFMLAWPDDGPLLTVAGDGPIRDEVSRATKHNVRYVGRLSAGEMRRALRQSLAVAMPSVWPEALPLIALEAFAEGTPVVAFQGGSLGSVVDDVSSRCLAQPPRFADLAERAISLTRSPDWQELSDRCVDLWRSSYSHPMNQESLLRAYEQASAR